MEGPLSEPEGSLSRWLGRKANSLTKSLAIVVFHEPGMPEKIIIILLFYQKIGPMTTATDFRTLDLNIIPSREM